MKGKLLRCWMVLSLVVLACSLSCAGNSTVPRIRRPPLPDERALIEAIALCQPTGDRMRPCQPTRIEVHVCEPRVEGGCAVRRGVHDLLRWLNAYDNYIQALNGDG